MVEHSRHRIKGAVALLISTLSAIDDYKMGRTSAINFQTKLNLQ